MLCSPREVPSQYPGLVTGTDRDTRVDRPPRTDLQGAQRRREEEARPLLTQGVVLLHTEHGNLNPYCDQNSTPSKSLIFFIE